MGGTLLGRESETLSTQLLREAFTLFDLDKDGHISEQELRVILSGHGPLVEVLPDGSTVDNIMKEVGHSDRGISFESFAAYINKAAARSRCGTKESKVRSRRNSKDAPSF